MNKTNQWALAQSSKPILPQKMDNHSQGVGLKPGLIAGTNPRPEGRGNGSIIIKQTTRIENSLPRALARG